MYNIRSTNAVCIICSTCKPQVFLFWKKTQRANLKTQMLWQTWKWWDPAMLAPTVLWMPDCCWSSQQAAALSMTHTGTRENWHAGELLALTGTSLEEGSAQIFSSVCNFLVKHIIKTHFCSSSIHIMNTFINLIKTHMLDLYSCFIKPSAHQWRPEKVWRLFFLPSHNKWLFVCLVCVTHKAGVPQLPGCCVISGPRLSRGWLTNPSTICAKTGCQLPSPQGKLASIMVCMEVLSQPAVAVAAGINWGFGTPFGGLTLSSEHATGMSYL